MVVVSVVVVLVRVVPRFRWWCELWWWWWLWWCCGWWDCTVVAGLEMCQSMMAWARRDMQRASDGRTGWDKAGSGIPRYCGYSFSVPDLPNNN